MYYKYFIDFIGTLTILYAKIYTDANPPIMALVYFAMIYLGKGITCLLYTSPSPRDRQKSRMPSSA